MPQLTKITPSTQGPGHISLSFEDGVSFDVAALDLRFACPCANCVDEMTGKRTLKRESIKPDVRPTEIQPVGRYGIHIAWSDGHRTGMYHFDSLYAMRPKK
jgi:DUF971 family protein